MSSQNRHPTASHLLRQPSDRSASSKGHRDLVSRGQHGQSQCPSMPRSETPEYLQKDKSEGERPRDCCRSLDSGVLQKQPRLARSRWFRRKQSWMDNLLDSPDRLELRGKDRRWLQGQAQIAWVTQSGCSDSWDGGRTG